MCTIMKGGILQAYGSVLRVTHGILVNWISLKCSLIVSLRIRLLFIGHSLAIMCIFIKAPMVWLLQSG